ncbi:DegT/DnrJ/EryC1/StrS family aminotransferase [Kroppenstedtia pulmonis]|uniref:DegT/DnrJ/EryC1/StrS family aminotransferase n=2 Tax=Kroppenstedtia pulmonis TaxID=1380685 RepID=A0A7D3XJE0_9BACL|nr:DegT/DnrJ/EryC1/StrS family aminotransferase [Kroppenstedtia pulmonis]
MSYQLFVPEYRVEECLAEIRECLEVGWTGIGFKTIQFEEEWKRYTGLPYAHFLSSATAGLSLAFKVLKDEYGWEDGDEVISTSLTFVASNHAALYHNLKVVFADVDSYLCLDPEDVERKITSKTRAVLFVGMGGNTGQYPEIVNLCRKYNLKLILDAAHMAGTRLKGKIPGQEADVVVYSFQAVKNMAIADAGIVCFSEKKQDELCRKLAWLGIDKDTYARANNDNGRYKWRYDVDHVGYKYHGNSIMAAIGLVQLKYLDRDNAYRRQLAQWYDEAFQDAKDRVQPIPTAPGCESSQHLYIINVENRDDLLNALNQQGIYAGVHYRNNTEYHMYRYGAGTCPQASRLSKRIISLPLHLKLTRADVQFIAKQVIQHAKLKQG